jgi:hypothetical protein
MNEYLHNLNEGVHNLKIEDRRRKIASLLAQSMTETEIAQELSVDQPTISRRRLRIFFNHINLLSDITIEQRCNLFAAKGIKDPTWAFSSIVKFLQFQMERVEKSLTSKAVKRFRN